MADDNTVMRLFVATDNHLGVWEDDPARCGCGGVGARRLPPRALFAHPLARLPRAAAAGAQGRLVHDVRGDPAARDSAEGGRPAPRRRPLPRQQAQPARAGQQTGRGAARACAAAAAPRRLTPPGGRRPTVVRTLELLRKYCMNDSPVNLQVLSDQATNFSRRARGGRSGWRRTRGASRRRRPDPAHPRRPGAATRASTTKTRTTTSACRCSSSTARGRAGGAGRGGADAGACLLRRHRRWRRQPRRARRLGQPLCG